MSVFQSRISTQSDVFAVNAEAHAALLGEVRALEAKQLAHSNGRNARFAERGQLPPRERVARLLDPGAPWIELSPLAGLGLHYDDGVDNVFGAGSIAGIGFICGVRCAVSASEAGIKGGTTPPIGVDKGLRLQTIALRHKLPLVSLVESGGANLEYQSQLFLKGGETFRNQALLSSAGIPQVVVVHGSSTAGGAYIPGMADYSIFVRGRAKVFLAGPPLLKAATGEIADDETLGGAEMHTGVSGVGDFLVEDDRDAINLAREVIAKLGWNDDAQVVSRAFDEPQLSPDELPGVVPVDFKKPYDIKEVIARVVDGSDLLEFKPRYGPSTVCATARAGGFSCAFLANNGPIDADGAAKAAQFMQLCDQAGTPLVFLVNTTGFIVGTKAEQSGIVKHGSKMIQAVANARVAKITFNIGANFGAGNYAMCGRGFHPNFLFSWPNAKTAVMGGEQAGRVLRIVSEEKAVRAGLPVDDAAMAGLETMVADAIDKETGALFATARLWDDGIIDPRDTRRVLIECLDICADAERRTLRPNSFGVGRM